jgi:glutamate-5-semialdehyde dehydrogenase
LKKKNGKMLTETFNKVKDASISLALIPSDKINQILRDVADAAIASCDYILGENQKDLDLMDKSNPMYDRLMLTKERIEGIAADTRKVAELPSPLGRVLKHTVLPNGLDLKRVSVPFGVIGVVYEARPNVTFDVFALCLKSGNACVLKGGKDADNSNRATVKLVREVLSKHEVDEHTIELLPATHEATAEMLHANGFIDLVIPRGSKRLIDFVRREASVPVIETGAGVCHAYFDKWGDTAKGAAVINNAKTRRVSVCNALDCLLIDRDRLADLPALVAPMAEKNVIIYADEDAFNALHGNYPHVEHATEDNWGTEYMDYKMSVKTVAGIDEALAHIATHSSKHSECIVAECADAQARFGKEVDAACVYANVPTSFTDGGQFGFGAEIGISTQKLHARGPMGLPEITTYKYIITGDGQIRNS